MPASSRYGEDLVLRWGGEEFVLLLYGSTLDDACHVIARIRAELRNQGHGLVAWPLTVSVGLTGGSVPDDDSVLQSWLKAADQALLRAKQAGQDRVEVAWTYRELN